MDRHRSFLRVGLVLLAAAALVIQALPAQAGIARGSFRQTNLVSDVPGLAPLTDPNLVNPWGLSSRLTSPIWVSDNGKSVSTLYTGAGDKVNLTVHIPAPDGTLTGTPTGTVSNITSDFVVPSPTGPAPSRFLFATEDGTVLGWAGGSNATIKVDNSLRAVGLSQNVADSIFRTYVMPFEIVSMLLLAALVGAVAIARRD